MGHRALRQRYGKRQYSSDNAAFVRNIEGKLGKLKRESSNINYKEMKTANF